MLYAVYACFKFLRDTNEVSLMEKIASFTVDHELLEPGVYVSRRDTYPNTSYEVTTFDIRMCAPNREPVIDTAALHALEHMGATYLRNNKAWASRAVSYTHLTLPTN